MINTTLIIWYACVNDFGGCGLKAFSLHVSDWLVASGGWVLYKVEFYLKERSGRVIENKIMPLDFSHESSLYMIQGH